MNLIFVCNSNYSFNVFVSFIKSILSLLLFLLLLTVIMLYYFPVLHNKRKFIFLFQWRLHVLTWVCYGPSFRFFGLLRSFRWRYDLADNGLFSGHQHHTDIRGSTKKKGGSKPGGACAQANPLSTDVVTSFQPPNIRTDDWYWATLSRRGLRRRYPFRSHSLALWNPWRTYCLTFPFLLSTNVWHFLLSLTPDYTRMH